MKPVTRPNSKFNPENTVGISVGDRVTVTNSAGDSAAFEVGRVESTALYNKMGTDFKISGFGSTWTITGVEFKLPETSGFYMTREESPKVVSLSGGLWRDGMGTIISADDAADMMPFDLLVNRKQFIDSMISWMQTDGKKHDIPYGTDVEGLGRAIKRKFITGS